MFELENTLSHSDCSFDELNNIMDTNMVMEWNNYVYESVVFYCAYFAWQNGYQLCSLWLSKQNEKRVWNIIPLFSSQKP